ncbi:hypothetical protein C5B42_03790 [Candidatus Cerribacteria bacterium 'Amazon FNV 2010 28 9']|uniref:ComEC/Rec2-related protein domain-containing protein n=1 Tax=Candidatus Cerribacteria bacterium 'Amazon FNV 2010 28 9' TaxID=2081795 RepID=A0A317JSF1_9BACT|nr:MAG: hypothetical protein C5B42_03790 [Candidatus Cerribacteria bacterium 'Amazon FNV 2010 28 9']
MIVIFLKYLQKHQKSAFYFVALCIVFICIYLPRFTQENGVRKLILQSRSVHINLTIVQRPTLVGTSEQIKSGVFTISFPQESDFKVGDHIEAIGTVDAQVSEKRKDEIPLISQSILHVHYFSSSGHLSFVGFLREIEDFCDREMRLFTSLLGSPHAPLLWGILFGGSSGLTSQFTKEFTLTGLSHVLSASGFNVVIVLSFSLSLFMKILPKRLAVFCSLVAIIIYMFFCGFSPPVLRAVIMAAGLLLSTYTGREYSGQWWLLISSMILLIYQPFYIYSVSFQLTVAASYGLLFLLPLFPQVKKRKSVFGELCMTLEENFWTTVAALTATAPILISTFSSFSLVAIIANTSLLWLVSPIMLFGLVLLFASLILPLLVLKFVAIPLWILLEVFIQGIGVFSRVPYASLPFIQPTFWGVFLYYCILEGWRIYCLAKIKQE